VNGGEVLALRQEMSISHEEFLRALPAAVECAAFRAGASEFAFAQGGKGWRIVLTRLSNLEIGSITLPRQRVEIFLTGYDEASSRQFLERFERYFRRGGG
jgi:hypothetical protein